VNTQAGLEVLLGQCRHELLEAGSEFNQHREKIKWGQDGANDVLYLKQANSTKQSEYIALTNDNYIESIKEAWKNSNSWENSSEGFTLKVFAYTPKQRASQNPRATASRINDELAEIQAYAQAQETVIGPATSRYLAERRARQLNPGEVTLPNGNQTYTQLVHIDREQMAIDSTDGESANVATIELKINNCWVKVEVKIKDLREALGLPHYNLMEQGFFSVVNPPEIPMLAENIPDAQHSTMNNLGSRAEDIDMSE
jgi:hypothetical protein